MRKPPPSPTDAIAFTTMPYDPSGAANAGGLKGAIAQGWGLLRRRTEHRAPSRGEDVPAPANSRAGRGGGCHMVEDLGAAPVNVSPFSAFSTSSAGGVNRSPYRSASSRARATKPGRPLS